MASPSSAASLINSLISLSLSTPPSPSQPPAPPLTLPLSSTFPSQTLTCKKPLSPLTHRSTSTSNSNSLLSSDLLSVLYPSSLYSNTLFFKSAYNIQVVPYEDENADSLVDRFRGEALRARIIQECKRRRFHETNQEKRKRKSLEAARRYGVRRLNRHLQSRWEPEVQHKRSKDDDDDDDGFDNWEY